MTRFEYEYSKRKDTLDMRTDKAKATDSKYRLQDRIKGVVMVLIYCLIVGGLFSDRSSAYYSDNIEKTQITWNNRIYSVQVWKDRLSTMRYLGYSDTRILDLLAILNMECGSYKGNCFNGNDVGPFQINKIHKEQYNKSWEYYNKGDWGSLFVYQLKYANKLLDSYESRFCGEHIFREIGKTYTNRARWECIGKSYNGHPRYKFAYVKLGWERRSVISDIIFR